MRLLYRGVENYSKGRVEVFHEGQWGTVCDNGLINQFEDGIANEPLAMGQTVAEVICRELGFNQGVPVATKGPRSSDRIWMKEVKCEGEEESLLDCDITWNDGDAYCEEYEDLTVQCS